LRDKYWIKTIYIILSMHLKLELTNHSTDSSDYYRVEYYDRKWAIIVLCKSIKDKIVRKIKAFNDDFKFDHILLFSIIFIVS
jgi:hypothetical protein